MRRNKKSRKRPTTRQRNTGSSTQCNDGLSSDSEFQSALLNFDGSVMEFQTYWALRSAKPSERMKILIEVLKDKEFTPVVPDLMQKSKKKAVSLRTKGNAYFEKKEYEEALSYYTQSIAYAPPQSETLACAFANRAALLIEMKFFLEAIADCQRALKSGYSKDLEYKMFYRQALCYESLGQNGRTLKSLNKALDLLQSQTVTEEKAAVIRKIEDKLKYGSFGESEEDFENLTQNPDIGVLKMDVPNLGEKFNPELPTAADCIALEYNERFGRHLIATRDIEIGEVLIVEKPFAACLFSERAYDHCSHCFKLCRTLLPCENCNWAMFCSEICMAEAESYHKLECSVMHGFTEADKVNMLPLVMRCVTRPGFDQLTEYFNKEETKPVDKRKAGFNENNQFISTDINAATNLFYREPTDIETYLRFGLGAARIFLKFQLNKLPMSSELGGYILKLMMSLNCNGNGVMEFHKHEGFSGDLKPLAGSIYPTWGLINHSCNDNTFYHFYGNTLVVRAANFIKKGSQIFHCSSKSFLKYSKQERQKILLARQNFKCECEACTQNWPQQEGLPRVPGFYDHDQHLKLGYIPLWKMILEKGIGDLGSGWRVTDDTFKYFKDIIQWLDKNGKFKCGMYYIMRECVRVYFMMKGNHVKMCEDDGLRPLDITEEVILEVKTINLASNQSISCAFQSSFRH